MRYEYRGVNLFESFWIDRINENAAEGFRVIVPVKSHSSTYLLMEREVSDESDSV